MTPIEILKAYYDREQNVSISSFWDGGWTFKIGDDINGFRDYFDTDVLESGFEWLEKQLSEPMKEPVFKTCQYIKSLDSSGGNWYIGDCGIQTIAFHGKPPYQECPQCHKIIELVN